MCKRRLVLTASRLLVRIVLAVLLVVAELRARDALVRARRPALGAQVLVVGAGDGGAVGLVRPVGAVAVPVAVVRGGDAQRVGAAELPDVAGREACTTRLLLSHSRHGVDFCVTRTSSPMPTVQTTQLYLLRIVFIQKKIFILRQRVNRLLVNVGTVMRSDISHGSIYLLA